MLSLSWWIGHVRLSYNPSAYFFNRSSIFFSQAMSFQRKERALTCILVGWFQPALHLTLQLCSDWLAARPQEHGQRHAAGAAEPGPGETRMDFISSRPLTGPRVRVSRGPCQTECV
jgi:hypothetical protein